MARGRKSSFRIVLFPTERETLQRWQRSTTMAAGVVRRGRMILLLADRHSQSYVARLVGIQRGVVRKWVRRFVAQRLEGLGDAPGRGAKGGFSPEVALYVVHLACERPDTLGRNLSQWDCQELARQLIAEEIVEDISAATVRQILASHQLKPRRHHLWLHPKQPRDAAFYATISELIDLYTRPLRPDEMVLSMDEKTSRQPCPRQHPTQPAQPENNPNRCEHEYKRAGALNLFAAFDTRSGKVYGNCYERKWQQECIAFLEALDMEIDAHISTIHLACDHVSTYHGKEVRKWFANHPRFVVHFTLVYCV